MAKILVVDDDPFVRKMLERAIARMPEGYECDFAVNGESALELFLRGSYGLLITDVDMPGMGGVELARLALTEDPGLPIIGMSGKPEPPGASFTVFLNKPVSLSVLAEEIRNLIRQVP